MDEILTAHNRRRLLLGLAATAAAASIPRAAAGIAGVATTDVRYPFQFEQLSWHCYQSPDGQIICHFKTLLPNGRCAWFQEPLDSVTLKTFDREGRKIGRDRACLRRPPIPADDGFLRRIESERLAKLRASQREERLCAST